MLLQLGHVSRDVEAELQGDLTLLVAKQTWQLVRLSVSSSRGHVNVHTPASGSCGDVPWPSWQHVICNP